MTYYYPQYKFLCNLYIKYFFDKSRLVESRIMNKDWIEKYIDHSDLDVKYVNKFLGLLACEVWYRLFITKEIDSNDTLN